MKYGDLKLIIFGMFAGAIFYFLFLSGYWETNRFEMSMGVGVILLILGWNLFSRFLHHRHYQKKNKKPEVKEEIQNEDRNQETNTETS